MKAIVRGAIGPALIVAALQCLIELVFAFVFAISTVVGKPLKPQFSLYADLISSQITLLIGTVSYAGRLRRRSGASLSGCTVGGATVGLLANFMSQAANGVLICLAVIVMVDKPVWTMVFVLLLFSCLSFGIVGLIIGEVGGGAVGLLSLWRVKAIDTSVIRR